MARNEMGVAVAVADGVYVRVGVRLALGVRGIVDVRVIVGVREGVGVAATLMLRPFACSPNVLLPHPTSVPSDLSATECDVPAVTATTSVNPLGMVS